MMTDLSCLFSQTFLFPNILCVPPGYFYPENHRKIHEAPLRENS